MRMMLTLTRAGFMYECLDCGQQFEHELESAVEHKCEGEL